MSKNTERNAKNHSLICLWSGKMFCPKGIHVNLLPLVFAAKLTLKETTHLNIIFFPKKITWVTENK